MHAFNVVHIYASYRMLEAGLFWLICFLYKIDNAMMLAGISVA